MDKDNDKSSSSKSEFAVRKGAMMKYLHALGEREVGIEVLARQ